MLRKPKKKWAICLILSLLIGVISSLAAEAEIKLANNVITMTISDYRTFVTEIESLKAANESLTNSLKKEEENVKNLIASIMKIEETSKNERKAANERIAHLEKQITKMRTRNFVPGIIGGVTYDDDQVQGTIGIGWKLNLF